jgi:hypothetical protein
VSRELLKPLPSLLALLVCLQGDRLVWLLSGALVHDITFMCAASQYRANRDRVITMGMSLHERAMALHRWGVYGGAVMRDMHFHKQCTACHVMHTMQQGWGCIPACLKHVAN